MRTLYFDQRHCRLSHVFLSVTEDYSAGGSTQGACRFFLQIWITSEKRLITPGLEDLPCHHVNFCPGRASRGEDIPRSGPLQVLLLVCSRPRHTRRFHHDGGGVRRVRCPRLVHLRGRHHHLPQPDLVGVLVHGEHRCPAWGAGGRRGPGQAEKTQIQPGGEARVLSPLQHNQELFQK